MDGQEQPYLLGRYAKQKLLKQTDIKEIWLLENITSGEKCVAKTQPKSKLDSTHFRNVLNEASYLQIMQGHIGIPFMYWSGVEEPEILLITEYLGATVEQRLQECGGKFTPKTTYMIGLKILAMIRNLHEKGFVHRNINPSSLQFGRGTKVAELFFNDLTDCKRFRNKKTFSHINDKSGVKNTFKNSFGSERFHSNKQISRSDDIESLILVLIYLISGVAPSKKGKIIDQSYPPFFNEMLAKSREALFTEEPNYAWFEQKLKSVLFTQGLQNDSIYDWMLRKNRNSQRRISKHIVSIKTEKDESILRQVYEPYQENIDIDQLSTKYFNMYGINEAALAKCGVMNNQDDVDMGRVRKRNGKQKRNCELM